MKQPRGLSNKAPETRSFFSTLRNKLYKGETGEV